MYWLILTVLLILLMIVLYLEKRRKKSKVKVFSSLVFTAETINGVSDEPKKVSLGIVNKSSKPIYLKECTIQLGKETLAFADGSHIVNQWLNPGKGYIHFLDFYQIKSALLDKGKTKLNAIIYFLDKDGKKYKDNIKLHW
ncbi:hypothetical protein JOD45_000257 [Scopulibacillus daqui]|uniref:DUF4352 domain-containing protein n=1 Tax=Scopulibacillus daqui TaxID=1469162 RepID=A0ABS2PVV9_9BACL|nr:hypothetical protein [Scopulibacillus daqui]MBM7644066.1 hypothetical protein [Scopulibacillus daqui]